MLLRDGDLTPFPALAQLTQVREQRLLEDDVDGERGEEPIERDLRSRLVERLEGRAERRLRVAEQGRVRAAAVAVREHEPGGLRGRQPAVEVARIASTRATSASP